MERRIVLVEEPIDRTDEFVAALKSLTGWRVWHIASFKAALSALKQIGDETPIVLITTDTDYKKALRLVEILNCAPGANRAMWPQILVLARVKQSPEVEAQFRERGADVVLKYFEGQVFQRVAVMKYLAQKSTEPLFRIVVNRGVVEGIYLIGPRGQAIFAASEKGRSLIAYRAKKHHRQITIKTLLDYTQFDPGTLKVYNWRDGETFDKLKKSVGLGVSGHYVFRCLKVSGGYVYEFNANAFFVYIDDEYGDEEER